MGYGTPEEIRENEKERTKMLRMMELHRTPEYKAKEKRAREAEKQECAAQAAAEATKAAAKRVAVQASLEMQIINAGLRAMARKAHPDAGGSAAEMQALNLAAANLKRMVTK